MIINTRTAPQAENTIEVPRQTSFHCPEGKFTATIHSVNQKLRQSWSAAQPMLRFLFLVYVPGANINYSAKLDLPANLNEGSDLWNVLCRLVGRKALQDCSNGKFDLNSLIGITCDIQTQHIHDDRETHEFPLVVVTDLNAVGTLVKPDTAKV